MITYQQYGNAPDNLAQNANLTIHILNEIMDAFPGQFSFNSGYRTPAHNAAVGGVADSYHVKALAGDLTPLNGNYNYYKPLLTEIVSKYGFELIDERNKNHFHIEPSPNWNISDFNPSSNSSLNTNSLLIGLGLIWLLLG